MNQTSKKNYKALDGLRAIVCILVITYHMSSNNKYAIGDTARSIIGSLSFIVFIFMAISAFGMCCGYYKKMLNNEVNLTQFYKKRVLKILPYFGLLVILDVISERTLKSLYEGFADLTLVFGFGKNLSVIGVGWFIGTVFVFYMIFPFFCVLMENKRRAWCVLVIAAAWNYLAINHFHLTRMNILHSGCFFVLGGLIYLYKDKIEKMNRWLSLGLIVASSLFYYFVYRTALSSLLITAAVIMYAISVQKSKYTILDNKVFKFITGISMEIYLSHMLIFRVVEKLGLNTKFGNGPLQYVITIIIVLMGSILFAFIVKRVIEVIEGFLLKRFGKKESVA